MERLQRTHHCAELRADHAGTEAILNGWVHRTRDHGGLRFIDVRDWRGMTQVVVGDDAPDSVAAVAAELKSEYCVAIRGIVHERPETMRNPDLATGAIEVRAVEIVVLSVSATPPFVIDEVSEARDDLRLKYRYLDLRSFSMQRKLRLRHTVLQATRAFFERPGVRRDRDADLDPLDTGGRARLLGAVTPPPRPFLRPAAKPPTVQTDPDGLRVRQVLPDRPLLSR